MSATDKTYCGYITIVGKPNVGKSTLLNQILDNKVSITSNKPQTTQRMLHGIKTIEPHQFVFVDTPGVNFDSREKAIQKVMFHDAMASLKDADIIILLIDRTRWNEWDDKLLEEIKSANRPCLLCINKVDLIKEKSELLPFIQSLTEKHSFTSILPISALDGDNTQELLAQLKDLLPESPFYFHPDDKSDQILSFQLTEIIREKIYRITGEEVPYSCSVQLMKLEKKDKLTSIYANIFVERKSQKGIIIGAAGQKIKEIGSKARLDIEALLDTKVFLKLWVKVHPKWSEDKSFLKSLGFDTKGA